MLYALWGSVAVALASVVTRSLGWLADPKAGPSPGTAAFCSWAISLSLAAVMFVPPAVVLFEWSLVKRKQRTLELRITELRAAADERESTATVDGDALACW
ncbi:hypothetical protein ACN6K4_003943 [Streptomyces hayashii]|uniref:hypothetical protein n=1 Tax=Streptomyces hayashii TaxID=2839966 RepID=UPI00403D20D9